MSEVSDFLNGKLPFVRSTEHFAYSEVRLKEYPASHVLVIRGASIGFPEMAEYFTQADPFEEFLSESGVERIGTPLTWFYWNDVAQPLEPGGNPVREPFDFEVGYEVVEPPTPLRKASETAGEYITHPLRPFRVASVFYRGPFPHQEDSAFAESWMTLVHRAPASGYALTGRLYREIYHHLDYSDPTKSVTEIQVEIRH